MHIYGFFMGCTVPDGDVIQIRVFGSHNPDQCTQASVFLNLHDGAGQREEDGRLVHIRHTDPHDGLIPERAEIHETRVHVFVHSLHDHIMSALVLKVKRLKWKRHLESIKTTIHTFTIHTFSTYTQGFKWFYCYCTNVQVQLVHVYMYIYIYIYTYVYICMAGWPSERDMSSIYLFDGDDGLLCISISGDSEQLSTLLVFDQVTHICILAHVCICRDHPADRRPNGCTLRDQKLIHLCERERGRYFHNGFHSCWHTENACILGLGNTAKEKKSFDDI